MAVRAVRETTESEPTIEEQDETTRLISRKRFRLPRSASLASCLSHDRERDSLAFAIE